MKLLRRDRPPALLDAADAQAARASLAQNRSVELEAELEAARTQAKIREETAAAERRAAQERAEAQRAEEQAARDEAKRLKAEAAAERQARRAKRRTALLVMTEKLRPVLPILIVNAGALYAQVAYGFDHYSDSTWHWTAKAAIAVNVALAAETVAVYVGWHAHTALLSGATGTAAKLRRYSYLIAAVMACINYAHFCKEGDDGGLLHPTAPSFIFGLFSLLSPWLWGLHSRRKQHELLQEEGRVDKVGAIFSVERWRAFPLLTRNARRWSIYHGITDPIQAWDGYNAERIARERLIAAQPVTGKLARILGKTKQARVLADAALRAETACVQAEQQADEQRQRAERAEESLAALEARLEGLGAELESVRMTAAATDAEVAEARTEVDRLNGQVETLNYQLEQAVTGRRMAEQRAAAAERSAHRAEAALRSPALVGATTRAAAGDADSEPASARPVSAPPAHGGASAAEQSASKEERQKALVKRFTDNPNLQLDYNEFAAEQGCSPRTARRDIREAKEIARRNWIREELASRPSLSPADIAGRFRITEADAQKDLAEVRSEALARYPATASEEQRPRLVG